MQRSLIQFAAESTTKGGVFGALGIDWKTLVLQIVAFIILVWLLGKYVYPWLIRSVDARQAAIEAAAQAARTAQANAEETEKKIAGLLHAAQSEARDIIATAKLEASEALADADDKARARGDQIIADAQDQIARDIAIAKQALHDDTLSLVMLATEKVLGKAVTKDIDNKVITESLKEVR